MVVADQGLCPDLAPGQPGVMPPDYFPAVTLGNLGY